MATAEQALFDALHLAPGRTRLFAVLSEVKIPKGIQMERSRSLYRTGQIGDPAEIFAREGEPDSGRPRFKIRPRHPPRPPSRVPIAPVVGGEKLWL